MAAYEEHLVLFDDMYRCTDTTFQDHPTIELKDLHDLTIYALSSNTDTIHISFTKPAAQARKFGILAPGGHVDISMPKNTYFDVQAWVKNAALSTEQQLYIVATRERKDGNRYR